MNYKLHYNALIARALLRQLREGEYVERHHIIPTCMGGLDNKENLVKLLPDEHLFAHRLLCRIYPNEHKLAYAVTLMCSGRKGRLSRQIYSMDRKRVSEANSRIPRKPISEEHRRIVSQSRSVQGYPCSDAHKEKLRQRQKERMLSLTLEAKKELSSKLSIAIKAARIKPCTVDGITWFRNPYALRKTLGSGKRGTRSKSFRFAEASELSNIKFYA